MLDWFPKNVSTFGGDIDRVFWLIFWIVGAWFLVAEGVLIWCLLRYRRREGVKASHIRGESLSQFAWVLIPTILVLVFDLGIDLAGSKAYDRVKGELPPSDLTVRVIGKQFNWEITYPGKDGRFDTPDDVHVENTFRVPTHKVVRVALRSDDVIHSFFVTVLRLKQDAVPGREIPVWFEVTEPGTYEIACAELCGFGHYTMRGELTALSLAEFSTWLDGENAAVADAAASAPAGESATDTQEPGNAPDRNPADTGGSR